MSDNSQVMDISTEVLERMPSPDGVRGATRIADNVVGRIAGMAAREVPGVYDLAEASFRHALAGQVQKMTGSDRKDKGVTVQVGQKETIIELNLIVVYEASIPDVAAEVRRNVADRVSGMTGLHVKEINIFVSDMQFPTEERVEIEPKLQ